MEGSLRILHKYQKSTTPADQWFHFQLKNVANNHRYLGKTATTYFHFGRFLRTLKKLQAPGKAYEFALIHIFYNYAHNMSALYASFKWVHDYVGQLLWLDTYFALSQPAATCDTSCLPLLWRLQEGIAQEKQLGVCELQRVPTKTS